MTSEEPQSPQPSLARVRIAGLLDVANLTKLINSAFVVEQPFLDGDRTSESGVRDFLAKGKFLIAGEFGNLAACVYCELRGSRGYLGLLSVDPARQGRGWGAKMVAAAEEYFRSQGCEAVDLRVISQRAPLAQFYRRLGYIQTGTAPFAPTLPVKLPGHYILISKALV